MTARTINLRTRRKQRARAAKRDAVSATPAPGISRLERERAGAENRRARDRLDGQRLDGRRGDDDG